MSAPQVTLPPTLQPIARSRHGVFGWLRRTAQRFGRWLAREAHDLSEPVPHTWRITDLAWPIWRVSTAPNAPSIAEIWQALGHVKSLLVQGEDHYWVYGETDYGRRVFAVLRRNGHCADVLCARVRPPTECGEDYQRCKHGFWRSLAIQSWRKLRSLVHWLGDWWQGRAVWQVQEITWPSYPLGTERHPALQPEHVVQAIFNRPRATYSAGRGRYWIYGETDAARPLFVVVDWQRPRLRVICARDMDSFERDAYIRE
jgi:uncharacterized DUF497 family protein